MRLPEGKLEAPEKRIKDGEVISPDGSRIRVEIMSPSNSANPTPTLKRFHLDGRRYIDNGKGQLLRAVLKPKGKAAVKAAKRERMAKRNG